VTDEPLVRVEDHDRVRTITFDRPEKLNAFNNRLYADAGEALAKAVDDDGLGAVVLTGEGRAFSAGQDLEEMAAIATDQLSVESAFPAFVDTLRTFPKPLLAAVNGLALGIGFTLLPYCDIVFVARSARAKVPFTELGVAPEAGSSYLFPRRMGWQRAARVLFTSDWLSAEELLAHGMALEVVDDEDVLRHTQELARRIAAHPVASLTAIKRLMLDSHAEAMGRARRLEDAAFQELLGSPDNMAALERFLER